jgi:hypothetical protein
MEELNLQDIIANVWDNGNCELFRMMDQCVDVGEDRQLYIDELVRYMKGDAMRQGYEITLIKEN